MAPRSVTSPAAARRRLLELPGGRVHLVEQGEGPLVLLLHGFPESWYSWRHQLPALAAAGYRAVAVDARGYGRSSRPASADAYRAVALVGETVRLVRELGERRAVLVGHDWGATLAGQAGLLRPEVFPAVALLGVPYTPPGGPRPSRVFAAMPGEDEFYVPYLQRPGVAEAEIERDVRGWLAGFYTSLSGGRAPAEGPGPYFVPRGGEMRARFTGGPLPSWLAEEELDVYAGEFERTGFFGALARYRNMDRDWEDLAAWEGEPLRQPTLFVAGAEDASLRWLAEAVDAFEQTLPALTGRHLLDGCGHWVQQERPEEVNELLRGWLADVTAGWGTGRP
ncbi:Pimeloyl-ACP methyl ester carboxylesterase [Streptomyces zhaozhouensis]|uniref:Pimeloyl-ACP methyl ester carboxylesterase n=1 Tax=Streptomyces zhaozhouensis TaxID=1300267 RepID=A0A286DZF9_9ACTN|nr:alpha/beta hydrolase [Streptomyces zhaozhouensis]SOD63974.1 Pimeloyl-ACP methyl ester carboxylesterase [Streptomyces zhaozhouensis]